MPPRHLALLSAPISVADRAVQTARLFGDVAEVSFWRLALFYLDYVTQHPEEMPPIAPSNVHVAIPNDDISMENFSLSPLKSPARSRRALAAEATSSATLETRRLTSLMTSLNPTNDDKNHVTNSTSLPPYFDMFRPAKQLRPFHIKRLETRERVSLSYENTQQLTSTSMMLGEHENAIRLLLETPSNTVNFRGDAMKACLIAALCSPETLESTVRGK